MPDPNNYFSISRRNLLLLSGLGALTLTGCSKLPRAGFSQETANVNELISAKVDFNLAIENQIKLNSLAAGVLEQISTNQKTHIQALVEIVSTDINSLPSPSPSQVADLLGICTSIRDASARYAAATDSTDLSRLLIQISASDSVSALQIAGI